MVCRFVFPLIVLLMGGMQMTIGRYIVSLVALTVCVFTAPAVAAAQTCAISELSDETRRPYLEAERTLLTQNDPDRARELVNDLLLSTDLNCYERGTFLRLSVAVNIELEDFGGAIADLLAVEETGIEPPSRITKNYFTISRLYEIQSNYVEAAAYRQIWLQNGGIATRRDRSIVALIHEAAGQHAEGIEVLEALDESSPCGLSPGMLEPLARMYTAVGDTEKAAATLARQATAERVYDEDTQPARSPRVDFPQAAIDRDLTGTCDVHFDVLQNGAAVNFITKCSNEIFAAPAQKAVADVFFSPATVDGKAVIRCDVVYPISFEY